MRPDIDPRKEMLLQQLLRWKRYEQPDDSYYARLRERIIERIETGKEDPVKSIWGRPSHEFQWAIVAGLLVCAMSFLCWRGGIVGYWASSPSHIEEDRQQVDIRGMAGGNDLANPTQGTDGDQSMAQADRNQQGPGLAVIPKVSHVAGSQPIPSFGLSEPIHAPMPTPVQLFVEIMTGSGVVHRIDWPFDSPRWSSSDEFKAPGSLSNIGSVVIPASFGRPD